MKSIILSNLNNTNLLPFIELFLSSFLGFGSALLVETIWDRHKDKKVREELSKELESELTRVIENANGLESEKVYMSPFSIPIWRGATVSGSILCLAKESTFSELLDVFSSIDEANQIETRCFELTVGNPDHHVRNVVSGVLEENRKRVIEKATHGITLFQRW